MSPRWALMHVSNLPVESAFVAEQRGGQQFRGWDEGRYMDATLINAVRILTYVLVLANSDPKKRTPDPPDPYPLPDKNWSKKAPGDKPGSFAFIVKSKFAAARKAKEERNGGR